MDKEAIGLNTFTLLASIQPVDYYIQPVDYYIQPVDYYIQLVYCTLMYCPLNDPYSTFHRVL